MMSRQSKGVYIASHKTSLSMFMYMIPFLKPEKKCSVDM